MIHCHNLVHEDHDMMVQFSVGDFRNNDPITSDPSVLTRARRLVRAGVPARVPGRHLRCTGSGRAASAVLALALGGCSTGTTGPAAGPALGSPCRPEAATSRGRIRRRQRPAAGVLRRADGPPPCRHRPPPRRRTPTTVPCGPLDGVAATGGVALFDVSPVVLDAATLDHLVPEVILALPAGRTTPTPPGWPSSPAAQGQLPRCRGVPGVATVLVHDLRFFEVTSSDPQRLSRSIAREGILSDALGSYTSVPGRGRRPSPTPDRC